MTYLEFVNEDGIVVEDMNDYVATCESMGITVENLTHVRDGMYVNDEGAVVLWEV